MKVEKKFTVNAPIEKVWSVLTEPQLIAQCIPGCEAVEQVEDNKYKATVRVEVGPIKTAFKLDIVEIERQEPHYTIYDTSGDEGGRASSVKAKSKLSLTATNNDQTDVQVTSDFNIVGRLGKFGSGMMNKIIDSLSADTISAICAYIERGELPTAKRGTGKLTLIFWLVIALVAAGVLVLVL